jgi:F-type H+-transporting ATPase subunit b
MRTSRRCHCCWQILGAAGLMVLLLAGPALADSGGQSWRPTYDQIMMYVNFIILVAVFYKFLKAPLADFFLKKREAIAREIKRMEDEKTAAVEKAAEATRLLEATQARLDQIRERIIREGEQIKAKIIEDAKAQSVLMIEEAHRKVESRILHAKDSFKIELIDAAVEVALARLPELVTEADNQRYIDFYLQGAS